MRLTRVRFILLATVFGFSVLYLLLGFFGPAPLGPTFVMAEEPSISICWPCFTNTLTVEIQDLSGNIIGEGEFQGLAQCGASSCSLDTELKCVLYSTYTEGPECLKWGETRSSSLNPLIVDPVSEKIVVTGVGVFTVSNQVDSLSFTATFQDNGDGTISAKYEVSRPEYSFFIPRTPGIIEFDGR